MIHGQETSLKYNISISDLNKLETLYQNAKNDIENIYQRDHYPVYPESIENFFHYLTMSVWCNDNYQPNQITNLMKSIQEASLMDIRSILTAAGRAERFSIGYWQGILKNDELSVVIERARELIKPVS